MAGVGIWGFWRGFGVLWGLEICGFVGGWRWGFAGFGDLGGVGGGIFGGVCGGNGIWGFAGVLAGVGLNGVGFEMKKGGMI